jgi:hypothetical protein
MTKSGRLEKELFMALFQSIIRSWILILINDIDGMEHAIAKRLAWGAF